MEYQYLIHEIKETTSMITLNRPDKLNCLNLDLWKELRAALLANDNDPNVKVHLITGAGKSFCAGDDIGILTDLVENPAVGKDLFIDSIYGLVDTIVHLQKPMVSAINGYAYGGGCEIALLSDLAIASAQATFALPEARIGAWPMIFATFGPFLLGPKHTYELAMIGEPISAERALSIGLINRVSKPENLLSDTFEMISRIRQSSPVALKTIKETASRALGERLYDFWISQIRALKESSRSHDWSEGAKSFLEKRPPRFTGN
ncbi:MAG: enoyl-CoA hydratase/isomerase family protein [Desulfobacteraceae bacterium]|nr:enoyl-CoA hydratase/isomerase family protein [Desulfobacteraceae bacterium]